LTATPSVTSHLGGHGGGSLVDQPIEQCLQMIAGTIAADGARIHRSDISG
jgi:hypothetical protein